MLILSVTANQQPDYLKSQLKNTAEMKLCIYDQWEERQCLLRGGQSTRPQLLMIVLRNHDLVVGILVNIQKGYLFPKKSS